MVSSAEHLRTALTGHLQARLRRRLAAMAGHTELDDAGASSAADFLLSEQAGEALAEAVAQGQIGRDAGRALLEQLVCVQAATILSVPRRELSRTLVTPESAAKGLARIVANTDAQSRATQATQWLRRFGPAARRLAQAHDEALALSAQRRVWLAGVTGIELPDAPDAAASGQSSRSIATQLLDATDDAASELLPWLCRSQRGFTWHGLLVSMRGDHIGLSGPVGDRFRRVASAFRRLGFERDMGRMLRVAVDVRQSMPFASTLAAAGVEHVHVAQGEVEYGLWSEMAAAEGVAAGLCEALAPTRLPVEARASVVGAPGAAWALGGLWMQLWADPVYLASVHGLCGAALDRTRRHASLLLLAVMRASAALSVSAEGSGDFEQRSEQVAAALRRALGCPIPVPLAQLWSPGPAVATTRCDGRIAGLALHSALRQALDEDWFVNPRMSERVRGAGARGASLDGWAWCREQGGQPQAAALRLLELLP